MKIYNSFNITAGNCAVVMQSAVSEVELKRCDDAHHMLNRI